MDLSGILSISGYGGLFKHISQARNSIIVESLIDKKRMPAYASAKISALEDISIYTEDDDVSLVDVFEKIYEKENGGQAISRKSSANELKAYFAEVLPDYDRERVYVSDIKRVLNWYNLLQKLDLLKIEEEEKSDTDEKSEISEREEPVQANETNSDSEESNTEDENSIS